MTDPSIQPALEPSVIFKPDPAKQAPFLEAFAAAQIEFQPVERNRLVTIKTDKGYSYTFRYAELATIKDATYPALNAHGISVSQPIDDDGTNVWLYTIVAHKEGGGRVTRIRVAGAAEIKAFGGEISYLRRYCLSAALGIASEDDAEEDGRGHDENDQRGWDDRPAPAPRPTPARKSAAPKESASAPAAQDAAPASGAGVTAGQVKNLQLKIKSLGLGPDVVMSMLARLNVPAIDEKMTLAQWKLVRAELDKAGA